MRKTSRLHWSEQKELVPLHLDPRAKDVPRAFKIRLDTEITNVKNQVLKNVMVLYDILFANVYIY